ncbi:hypothetical protein Q8I65_16925 [Paenibacillus ottowii]|nr:hypothetical protein [Paenibacillus ottowii]
MELREQRCIGSGGKQMMGQARAADEVAVRHEEESQKKRKGENKWILGND